VRRFSGDRTLECTIIGIVTGVVVVLILRTIGRLESRQFGHDWLWEDLLLIELRNLRLRQGLTLFVSIENRRSLRRSLPVQLCWIKRH